MKLIRYEYPTMGEFDRLFDLAFRGLPRFGGLLEGLADQTTPAHDLYEDADAYHLRFELPGVKKADVKVELENAVLTVSGTRKNGAETAAEFARSVSVPDGINPDKVKARFEDGILTVTLPKAEARKPRAIAVA